MARYGKDDAFSDFTIACNGVTFPVHRLVISMHSSFFERTGKSSFKENEERRVDLDDDPLAAVALMINYFYSFEYRWDDESLEALPEGPYGSSSLGWGCFLIQAQLAVIADKYDVEGLKTLAVQQFGDSIDLCLKDTSKPKLPSAAADMVKATKYIYEHTDPDKTPLRKMTVRAFQDQKYRLMRYAHPEDFESLLSEQPHFAADYVEAISGVAIGKSAEKKLKAESSTAGSAQL